MTRTCDGSQEREEESMDQAAIHLSGRCKEENQPGGAGWQRSIRGGARSQVREPGGALFEAVPTWDLEFEATRIADRDNEGPEFENIDLNYEEEPKEDRFTEETMGGRMFPRIVRYEEEE